MGKPGDHSQLIRAWRMLLILCCIGCGDWRGGEGASVGVAAPDRLAGPWDADFILTDAFRRQPSPNLRVHGPLLFIRIRSAPDFPDMTAPGQYGVYDVDFSPFGFDSRLAGTVPTAIGRNITVTVPGVDSVFIVLGPERRGVVVLMRGRLNADRAEGVWTAVSTTRSGIGESGRFVMTRPHSARN
jgi:hypothetical protein